MADVKPPTSHPCGSCPYRRDVPSGVWADEEYAKLPPYDEEMLKQPLGIFLCHQQNGHLCSGWTACHDMRNSLAIRFAVGNTIDVDDLDAILDFTTPVEIFSSGAEAAEHGQAEIETPGPKANRVIDKLVKKGVVTDPAR